MGIPMETEECAQSHFFIEHLHLLQKALMNRRAVLIHVQVTNEVATLPRVFLHERNTTAALAWTERICLLAFCHREFWQRFNQIL